MLIVTFELLELLDEESEAAAQTAMLLCTTCSRRTMKSARCCARFPRDGHCDAGDDGDEDDDWS